MKHIVTTAITIVLSCLWINSVLAVDCSGLPEWNNHTTYQQGNEVQYNGNAYEANATTRRDKPDGGDPWVSLGSCDTGGGVTPQPLSIYGVWHCGNHYCDWSEDNSDIVSFDLENHWIIDRGDGNPSVNLVVLSFIEPMELLNSTNYENYDYETCGDDDIPDPAVPSGVPRGMTTEVVNYFKDHGIDVIDLAVWQPVSSGAPAEFLQVAIANGQIQCQQSIAVSVVSRDKCFDAGQFLAIRSSIFPVDFQSVGS